MTGVVRWNFQRLVDLKQPDMLLPGVFDPVLMVEINRASQIVTGQAKYPALHVTARDTGERFGLQYHEPDCRPVPLDFEKNKTLRTVPTDVAEGTDHQVSELSSVEAVVFHVIPAPVSTETTDIQDPASAQVLPSQQQTPRAVLFHPPSFTAPKEESSTDTLMDTASPCAARTGPIKTGGRIFVLDHSRWTDPMRAAIDGLLGKHHGEKDLLKRVDAGYAAMVQSACTDPNSLLHPTTRQQISRYVKHLAKLINTSSSLNTSPEKLLETQQLWQRLTVKSQTVSIPVTPLPPAPVNPPTPLPPVNPPTVGSNEDAPLTKATVEVMVKEIHQKQQAAMQQQQQQQPKRTRTCLACCQPKSRYLNDGSSVHFFYQTGEVKYFYCSKKVFMSYSAEGLTNSRMAFEDFAATAFFQQELEASKQRGAERKRVTEERGKRKSLELHPTGRLCTAISQ